MRTTLLSLTVPALALAALTTWNATPTAAPAPSAAPEPAPFHCQVPCGIYGDLLRIDLLQEDAATIEKGMKAIEEFQAADAPNYNQVVRWTVTKDEHAQKVQDQVAAYWLAQRIKLPAADADEAARAKYAKQLELLHRVTVYAMKCKQTTDTANVQAMRDAVLEFSGTYFDEEDMKHVHDHHGADHK